MEWIFLLSGVFLGWSLGANDAANIFGTAVSSRMVRFGTAAAISAVFVLLGAVFSGAGATDTLGKLGAVSTAGGAFTVALASAVTVAWMTKARLPVSTSQAIVGAILGWNLFSGSPTDLSALWKIVATWVVCPILSGILALVLYRSFKLFLGTRRMHMLEVDAYTRFGLIVVGAFGAYSLGANNIANVMGVFVPSSPLPSLDLGLFTLSKVQVLFLVGAIAIGVGIFTYSSRVMSTVGNDLFKLTPIMALVVVLAESIVLFLFASKGLQQLLSSSMLPTIPLVPVSSSQAVIGAVVGLSLARGGRGLDLKMLAKVGSGWITTPIAALVLSFGLLYIMQNVFELQVHQ